MSEDELNLQYFLSRKGPILVVTFVGDMNVPSIQAIEKCTSEISATELVKFVILYFRDTKRIALEAIPYLATMQKEVRKKGELQICSMHPEMREKLSKHGIIRANENTNNLAEALSALKGRL